jgi:vancomycin resistance protein YoaR
MLIKTIIKWKLIILAGLLIGLSGLVSLYHLAYNQKIYPYIMVGSVDISNLRVEEARDRLEKLLPTGEPVIELLFGNQSWPVALSGLKYDTQATAESAYILGRSEGLVEDFKTKWRLWKEREQVLAKFEIDKEALNMTVDLILTQINHPSIEPALKLEEDGVINLTPGKNGREVDRAELIESISRSVGSLNFEPMEMKAEIIQFEITGEEFARAQERAEKLKDKSLRLSYESYSETLSGQELLDLIDFSTRGRPAPGWNEVKIASVTASLAKGINREPQNASFRFEGGKVAEFKPALMGQELDEEMTVEEMKNRLTELEQQECEEGQKCQSISVVLIVKTTKPEVSTEEVNDMGINELLGEGESTFHGSIASREHNVALTSNKLNGVLVAPGETFSFNGTIGDISAATGYQTAYIIKDGRTVLGDGGGVCQDSTTLFRAVLDAGLEIVQRHPHAYRVSYYEQNSPVGIDATVYSPSPDFKFKNDTPAHILIQTTVNTATNYLKFEIYGTSDGRVASISNTRLWDQVPPPPALYQDDPSLPSGTVKQIDWSAWGAKAAFDWKVVRAGEVIHETTYYSNYKPWQAVYLRGTGG